MVSDVLVGKSYVLEKDLLPLCCENILPCGLSCLVKEQTSPNRLLIAADGWALHRVKRSTFRMSVKE